MMTKGRNPNPSGKVEPGEEGRLHIRLCHHCGYVNEGLDPVGQCRRCAKHLTLDSFVDDLSDEELAELWLEDDDSDNEVEDGQGEGIPAALLAPRSTEDPFGPSDGEDQPLIQGLSVRW